MDRDRIYDALKAIGELEDPTEAAQLSQGGLSRMCRYCRATDYLGSVEHLYTCIWAALRGVS